MNDKNWQQRLAVALGSNDAEKMKIALEQVPKEHLQVTLQMIKDQGHDAFRQGRFEQALEAYNQVISLEAKDFFVLLHRADCLLQLDRPDEALEAAQHCASLHPEYDKSHRLLGRILHIRKDQAGALVAYKKAFELSPGDKKLAWNIEQLEKDLTEKQEMLNRVLDPEKAAEHAEAQAQEMPELPQLSFDPAFLFEKPSAVGDDNMTRGLSTFLNSFSDQEAPRELLSRVEDNAWLEPFLQTAGDQANKSVLFWGPEAGLLPLAAVDGGASRTVSWDTSPLTLRLTQGVIQKNLVARISEKNDWESLDKETRRKLFEEAVGAYQILPKPLTELKAEEIPEGCDVLMITTFDHGLLGKGVIDAVASCRKKLLKPNAIILPGKARIFAQAVNWSYSREGFDLSGLDPFHWSPYPIQLAADQKGWQALTQPQEVATIDLANFKASTQALEMPVTNAGTAHGIIFWFELELGDRRVSNQPGGALQSLGFAYQYLDNLSLAEGETLKLSLSVSRDRVLFEVPMQTKRIGAVPQWHINGLVETPFERTYAQSLKNAIERHKPKTLLNIGAGNGVLTMVAAKAGVKVHSVEISELMHLALKDNLSSNGLDQQVVAHHVDCRELKLEDGEKVDMIAFDAFDCGLLGDGILHYLQHVLAELAADQVTLLPSSACVKGMLIQRRIDQVSGFEASLLTPYLFMPEYINVDLRKTDYVALSEPFELFSFDFAKATVEEAEMEFKVDLTESGIVGAIAFWYELKLDDQTTLTTSPFDNNSNRGQGLQFLPEVYVKSGQQLEMKAKHTGSNLAFAVKPDGLEESDMVNLPRFDPNWMNMHRNVMHQSGQIMQQLRAHPEEYKKAFELAARMAIAPSRYGVSPSMAQRFFHTFLLH